MVEPLITMGKAPSLANKRLAFSRLRDRDAVVKLFAELGPRYEKRPGGYTRILKMGYRVGDAAPMAYVELVDRPEPVAADEAKGEGADQGRLTRAAGLAPEFMKGRYPRPFMLLCLRHNVSEGTPRGARALSSR